MLMVANSRYAADLEGQDLYTTTATTQQTPEKDGETRRGRVGGEGFLKNDGGSG
jgi:hypothetical protein